jgi:hypothetical protein
MDGNSLKAQLSRLNRHAYAAFIQELFGSDGQHEGHEGFYPLTQAGEDVFFQPLLDSYGGSIHRVYLLHHPALELFHPAYDLNMRDPTLVRQLGRVRNLYQGRVGYWGMVSPCLRKDRALKAVGFVTNLSGLDEDLYQEMLIPAYQRLKRFCGLKKAPILVGSPDSFMDQVPEKTERVFREFIAKHADGLVVRVSEHSARVEEFNNERWLSGGLLAPAAEPYESVFVTSAIQQRAVLEEFQSLLQESPTENRLEEFLVANYRNIFGRKYDRVETQLWLRFPELDINRHDRRLDVFLRNSVINDWELFEIKRPTTLSGTYRDMPIIAREVSAAISQTKNYGRILAQDKVKRHFANRGIEYFEPQLSVVIGRTPQIPHEQWRWLKTSHDNQVKIITYDDLLGELKNRIGERVSLLADTQRRISVGA